MLKIVGKTTDNKLVLSGVFDFHCTHGLPLDILFDRLLENDCVPSWQHYAQEASRNGMKTLKLISKTKLAVLDTFGKDAWNKIEVFLEKQC